MTNAVIPPQVTRYFWGDDLTELRLDSHKVYITQTILEKGDVQAVRWLFSHMGKQELLTLLPSLKLGPLSQNYWQTYFS